MKLVGKEIKYDIQWTLLPEQYIQDHHSVLNKP